MKIHSIHNNNNYPSNVAFNGQHLYALNLLRTLPNGTKEKVPAFFTELTYPEDLKMLESIENLWSDNTRYGQRIIEHFRAKFNLKDDSHCFFDSKFFAIEYPQFKNLNEKIRAIAEIKYSSSTNRCKIRYLQSASQINSIEKLEGQGTNMFAGIVKQAMDNDFSSVNLIPAKESVGFYEKLNINRFGESLSPYGYYVLNHQYQNVLTKIKEKYGKILPIKKN